jgi:hypothetical protein
MLVAIISNNVGKIFCLPSVDVSIADEAVDALYTTGRLWQAKYRRGGTVKRYSYS